MQIRKLALIAILCFLPSCTYCLAQEDDVSAIKSLEIEMLNWKKKYYIEHSLTIQLKAMNQVWNDVEFQDVQRHIREIDKQLKQLTILN